MSELRFVLGKKMKFAGLGNAYKWCSWKLQFVNGSFFLFFSANITSFSSHCVCVCSEILQVLSCFTQPAAPLTHELEGIAHPHWTGSHSSLTRVWTHLHLIKWAWSSLLLSEPFCGFLPASPPCISTHSAHFLPVFCICLLGLTAWLPDLCLLPYQLALSVFES